MKYWLLTSEYPPSFGAGIGTYASHTAAMLSRAGHEVTVVVKDEDAAVDSFEAGNSSSSVFRFHTNRTKESACLGRETRWSYDLASALLTLIDQIGPPDLIECQEYGGLPYFLLQRRWTLEPKFQRIPVVLTLHSPQFILDNYNQNNPYSLPLYWMGEMERYCLRAADALISPSQYLLDEIAKQFDLAQQDCTVIRNPYQNIPSSDLFPIEFPSSIDFLYCGRLEYLKGVLHLLRGCKDLWDQGFDKRLTLIGGDTLYRPAQMSMGEAIRQRYAAYIENGLLILADPVPPENLKRLMRQAQAVIVPSLYDNFPYAVIEPMALGATVIASSAGGQSEIIQDGINGFLFSHENPGSIKEALSRATSLGQAEMQPLGLAAQTRVRELCAYDFVYEHKIQVLERARRKAIGSSFFPFIRGPQEPAPTENGLNFQSNLLSVVIPYFNVGDFIEDALKALSSIKDPEIEVIVVDDGSDLPESIQALDSLSQKYHFRLFRKQNEGLAATRNVGALQARGEFLAFLDPDDTVEVDYYPRAIQILKTYRNVRFVGCWVKYWGDAQGFWPAWNPEPPYLLVHNTVASSSLVFRHADFLNSGLNDPDFVFGLEDYENVIHMVENGFRGVVIPQARFNYRVHSHSMMRKMNPNKQKYLYYLMAKKHAAFFNSYGAEISNILNANGPGYLYDNPTLYLPMAGFLDEAPPSEAPLSEAPPSPGSPPNRGQNEVPNLSASAFFYFAFRKIFLTGASKLGLERWEGVRKLKNKVKSVLVRPGDEPSDD